MENFKYSAGTIFKNNDNGTTVYWKITGEPVRFCGSYSYPVIRCNKNGLEFKETNGYGVNYVNDYPERIVKKVEVGIKASIDDGIESGVKKRRIQFLENAIKEYQKELNELLK